MRKITREPVHCHNCKKEIPWQGRTKKYCNHKCYYTCPDTKARKLEMGNKAMNRDRINCLNCGKEHVVKKSAKKRYCDQRCYREYMAQRFDRNVISKSDVGDLQNYDEFLIQTELRCPIKGCDWFGCNLGQHVNFTHGITARQFKKLCGFNLKTGLVTQDTSDNLRNRPNQEKAIKALVKCAIWETESTKGHKRDYCSQESKEHWGKSYQVRKDKTNSIEKSCIICGTLFIDSAINKIKKYCSNVCRDSVWDKKIQEKNHLAKCAGCGNGFKASYHQALRIKKSLDVFCSMQCRQNNNASYKRKLRNR